MPQFWKKLHWSRKAIAIFGLVAVIYTLVGFFGIPALGEYVVRSVVSEKIGRTVNVEDIDFNPYTFRVRARGLSLLEKDSGKAAVSLAELRLDISSGSIIRLAPVIEELTLVEPYVHFVLESLDKNNFSDLVPAPEQDETPADEPEEDKSPFPVLVENFEIQNGRLDFEDRLREVQHTVDKINMAVPFASTLPAYNERDIQPTLSAEVNGFPLRLEGRTLPFTPGRRTEFAILEAGGDLRKYEPYIPLPPGVKIASGTLASSADFVIERGEGPLPQFYTQGKLTLNEVSLQGPDGRQFFGLKALTADLRQFSLLQQIADCEAIVLDSPDLRLVREKDGSIDLANLFTPGKAPKPSAPEPEASEEPSAKFVFKSDQIILKQGKVNFTDLTPATPFHKVLSSVDVSVTNLSLAEGDTGTFNVSVKTPAREAIGAKGSITLFPLAVKTTISGSALQIPSYSPYYEDALPLDIASGELGLSLDFAFEGKNNAVAAENIAAEVTKLVLHKPGEKDSAFSVPELKAAGGIFRLADRYVQVGSLEVNNAEVRVQRDRKGKIDLAELFAGKPQPKGKAAPAKAPREEAPWLAELGALEVKNLGVAFRDDAAPKPVTHNIRAWAKLTDFSTTKGDSFNFTATVRKDKNARVSAAGSAVLDPLKGRGTFDLSGLTLSEVNNYLPAGATARLKAGNLESKGTWAIATTDKAVQADVSGSLGLSNFTLSDSRTGETFLSLKQLSVDGVDYSGGKKSLAINKVDLVQPRFSLTRSPENALTVVRALRPAGKEKQKKAAPAPQDKEEEKALEAFTLGSVDITDGEIALRDQRVSPEFTAALKNIQGNLEKFSLEPGNSSPFSLTAAFNGYAPISIKGQSDIMGETLDTSFRLTVEDLDLTNFSPYTVKYLAHPIKTGKARADMDITVLNKNLEAKNRILLRRMDFGPKVKNPDPEAQNLPLDLALSVLKDTRGDIHLNIPVRGRIDDPQFRMMETIFSSVMGLFVKAAFSPFSLLGSIFTAGGGEESGVFIFAPGSASLSLEELNRIDTISEALRKRPKLDVEIIGFADPETDAKALHEILLMRAVKRQKWKDMGDDAPANVDDVALTPEEYAEYLEKAYKEAPFEKPETVFGIVKSQPAGVMEQALREHLTPTQEDLKKLAAERARNVRMRLAERGEVSPSRLFLSTGSPGQSGNGKERRKVILLLK